MDPKKEGRIFIILMISLTAFGFGSCANALNSGNDVISGLLPSNFTIDNEQQLTVINDADFSPIHVMKQHYNITNTTNTTNMSTNTTPPTNSTDPGNGSTDTLI